MRLIDANAFSEMLEARANMAVGTVKSVFYNAKNMLDAMPTVVVMQTLSLNALRDEVYQDAVAHGLYKCEGQTNSMLLKCARRISREVSKLIVAVDNVLETRANGKDDTDAFEHYTEELADVIIMCLCVAGEMGIDIDAAVKRKMEINRARPWKHGKGE